MAAPVLPLQPIKLPAGPSTLTPEQTYWKTFKSQLQIPSPSNNAVTHISCPLPPTNSISQTNDYFAVTTGARVQIYSIRNRKLVKTISRFDDIVYGAEIRRDGRVLVAGDETGAIQVFDVGSRAILKTWKEHKQPVWVTKFSPTETTLLLSASDDRTVRIWDLPSQESQTTFVGHHDYVRSAAFMPGQASGLIVSGSYDETVKLWDPRAPSSAVMTFKHAAPVEDVLALPAGTTILAAADNQISVLDIIAAKPVHIIRNHQKTVTSLCLASQNTRLVSGGLDGHVKIFETTAWNVVAGSKYPSPVLSLSVIPSSSSTQQQEDRHLAVGLQSGILSLKTRLSGTQKAKERARQKQMAALISGDTATFDRAQAKKERRGKGFQTRLRGADYAGEDADIIIEGREPSTNHRKIKPGSWEDLLHQGRYADALDQVLTPTPTPGTTINDSSSSKPNLTATLTLLTALRHRSATRTALSGRDELTLQPILRWICRYIKNPRYVVLCVDLGTCILDLYAADVAESREVNEWRVRLHRVVREQVERSQQAWQTEGMLGMLLHSGIPDGGGGGGVLEGGSGGG